MFFKFNSLANSQPFFVATVQVNQANVSEFIATADQPKLFLGSETYYEFHSSTDTKNSELKNAYIEYVAQLAYLYCQDTNINCDKQEMLA